MARIDVGGSQVSTGADIAGQESTADRPDIGGVIAQIRSEAAERNDAALRRLFRRAKDERSTGGNGPGSGQGEQDYTRGAGETE